MTFIDWFSGIGGFRLGLERAGMECAGACEIDAYCRKLYMQHWPQTEWFADDITTVKAADIPAADIWCGGFPCQDVSLAGKRAGLDGARSGLWRVWWELARVVRPRIILVENVPGLLNRGMGEVIGDLAEGGYDAEWSVIGAHEVGAPHRRDRVWIVAWDTNAECNHDGTKLQTVHCVSMGAVVADASIVGMERNGLPERTEEENAGVGISGQVVADAESDGWFQRRPESKGEQRGLDTPQRNGSISDANGTGCKKQRITVADETQQPSAECGGQDATNANGQPTVGSSIPRGQCNHWTTEPDVGRLAHGIPHRVDRLKGLGNAVVPQVVEWIGRRIMQANLSD